MFPWEIILRSQGMYVPFLSIKQFHNVLIQPVYFNLGVKVQSSPWVQSYCCSMGGEK